MSKTQETGTEVVPWEDPTEAPAMIEPRPPLVQAAYAAIQDGQLPPEVGDPSVTARMIQDRIRNADSFDEVFGSQKLTPLSDLAGEDLTFHAFHLNPSSFADNPIAAYAVIEVSDRAGELRTVSSGGGNVLIQLVKAWEKGWFPFRARVVSKETRTPGRRTLWLEKAEG